MCLELLKSTYRIEAPSRPRLYEFAHEVASRMDRDVPITFYQTQKAEGLNVSMCFLYISREYRKGGALCSPGAGRDIRSRTL